MPFAVPVEGDRLILNPGSLLRAPALRHIPVPATGTYAVLDLPSQAFEIRSVDGREVTVRRSVGSP